MRTEGGRARGGKSGGKGRRANAAAANAAAAALFFVASSLLLLVASAANSPSSSSPPPFIAADTSPNGDRLENWALTSTIVPGDASSNNGGVVFVEPASIEEVQAIVLDGGGRFPSPLLTVGSGHSSGEVVSLYDPRTGKYRGTVLKTTNFKSMELEEAEAEEGGDGKGRRKKYFVRAGAGVELADLHDWLAARGLEVSMSPEIGDATVGSAAVASMKDSSVADSSAEGVSSSSSSSSSSLLLQGPPYPSTDLYKGMGSGYLGALVRGMRYVNASGALVDLDVRRRFSADASQIRALGGSFGLMGPVVDVLLETRPLALIESRLKIVPLGKGESFLNFARRLLLLRDQCDNQMILLSLGGTAKTGNRVEVEPGFKPFAYVEMRTRRRGAEANVVPVVNRALVSWWFPEIMRKTKYDAFAKGFVPGWLLPASRVPAFGKILDGGAAAVKHRNFFVNRYGPVTPGQPRLSFTYYELVDFERFPEAVAALMELARDFEMRTGFAPGALAIYFVKRSGEKETSNYSGPKGISCTLDPVTGAPGDPRFKQLLRESDALIQSLGGRLSPSQSLPSALERGGGEENDGAVDFGGLDQTMISGKGGARFATPYLRRAFLADARAQELKRAGRWEAALGARRG